MLKELAHRAASRLRNPMRAGSRLPAPATATRPGAARPLRLSVVVPTYNAEPYIGRLLHSIFTQTSHLRSFEVIIVDDGSTDDSAGIARQWQERYPDHIRYVYQDNAGPSVARNTGMALARGTWITFPDSDDFLDRNYFRKMLKETERQHELPLLVVSANLIPYHEATGEIRDNHPLRYRFARGITRLDTADLKDHMQLNVATCWLHRETILRHGLTFDPRIRPGSEDTHFINLLFLRAPGRTITFLPEARYYYRKRVANNSIINTGHSSPQWYLDQIEYGILALLRESHACLDHVPRYLQRTCLYVLVWRFRHLVNHEEATRILTADEQVKFADLLARAMEFIEPSVISQFHLAGCTEEHKVALLWRYHQLRRDTTAVYLQQIDSAAGMVQFSCLAGGDDDFTVSPRVNGREVAPELPSRRRTFFMGETWFQERFFWVRMEDGDEITFEAHDTPCRIRHRGKALGDGASWFQLRAALELPPPEALDSETRRLRDHVRQMRNRYRGCLVFMDRPDRADDNAEHLYRHMMQTGRAGHAWFILRRDSPDWERLEAEGFRLLEFRSDDHVAALMNASLLLSSHADHFVLWPVEQRDFKDLARYQFVFLQHGVILTDLSMWLNSRPIRLFPASMEREARSISDESSNYTLTTREVLHSGLPRHDALLRRASGISPDSILIMPSWRKYLTDSFLRDGTERQKIDGFSSSTYWQMWRKVLCSERLSTLSSRHDLPVTFLPHPNMAMYLDEMELPEWLQVVDVRQGMSYQEFLAAARVAITDISSAASEVALLQRPVIYFQFDTEDAFAGGHVCRPGYFSFEHDGFGPVESSPDAVLDRLEQALTGQEDPVYAARRDAAFPFRDGGCCERVCRAVDQLLLPRPTLSPLRATRERVDNAPTRLVPAERHGKLRTLAGR